MQNSLLITGGQVFLHQNNQVVLTEANILILNGKIARIFPSQFLPKNGASEEIANTLDLEMPDEVQKIDARHLHIFPGIIDSQVHFREPGLTHKEDLESGTRAAALGGVTSVFEMPNTKPSTISQETFAEKVKLASNRAWVNFAFYVGACPENLTHLAELENLPGCAGIKIFMGSSTGSLLVEDDQNLEIALRNGKKRVIVHSEDEARLRLRKHIALESHDVRNHHIWRDVETALRSTQRLLTLARKVGRPVHVLHVTTAEEVQLLKLNKDIATFEITPNHLTLWAPDCYETLGSRAQMNPPIREKFHYEALWQAIQDGSATVIGTDHAPHTLEEKAQPYPNSPSGMPGVQTLVPIMLDHAHHGKLSLARIVELLCENPRKVFGCQSKGRIAVGMDADLTIVDLQKQRVLRDEQMASKCAWTPFHDRKVTGWPIMTIVGGKVVMQEDQLLNAKQGTQVLFS